MNFNKKNLLRRYSTLLIASGSLLAGIGISYLVSSQISSKHEAKKWIKKQNELKQRSIKLLGNPMTREEKEVKFFLTPSIIFVVHVMFSLKICFIHKRNKKITKKHARRYLY